MSPSSSRAYLDNAATTPVRGEVREAMAPFLTERFGNPSSLHAEGRAARSALEEARERIAAALGARAGEIHFVRGGTESDNLAVLGRADLAKEQGRRPFLAVSAVEHRAVLEPAAAVERDGGRVLRLGVEPTGIVDEGALATALVDQADLVSVMWVNNEVGLRLPVEEVAQRCREAGVRFHTDAVQALGKVALDLARTPVDLLTASGHKIEGPKGTGILFCREGTAIRPRLFGGGQEERLRPGTEDVAGAVGMAEAVVLACRERAEQAPRLERLRDQLQSRLDAEIPDLRVHGSAGPRAPHILNVGVPGADLESLLVALDLSGVSVSSGSACSSGAVRASHVLRALYGAEVEGLATVRFSLGRSTDDADIRRAAEAAVNVVSRMRGAVAG